MPSLQQEVSTIQKGGSARDKYRRIEAEPLTAPATMRTERRCVQRKRPGGISYFEFEAGSGGIILDASEKGLGFQAADALHQLGPSRIWISPRPEERIELTGDVVWTDTSRKTGGLRFIQTGADSTKKIRTWLGQQDESEMSARSEGFPLPAWATQALGDLRDEERPDANVSRSIAEPRVKAQIEERPAELHSIPGLPSLFTSSVPWQPEDSQTSERGAARRVATGFLMVVLVVAGVVLFDMFRPKVGDYLIHLGERINGSARSLPQNTSPQPGLTQVPAQPSPMSQTSAVQTGAKPDVSQKETPRDSGVSVESSRQVNTPTSDTAMSRSGSTTKEATNGSRDREVANSRRDRSAEASRLWSAVASGDSSAEVDLARLYLKGEGVPRNCVQAKVLLRAAAKGGSWEARQQLRKLPSSGCR